MVLKDVAIADRATVFEENSVSFCERHELGVARQLPAGHRATWEDRALLAIAKLEPKLAAGTTAKDFPGIVLAECEQDFIEVHIFGSLSRKSIERIVARCPKSEADRILLDEVKRFVEVEAPR